MESFLKFLFIGACGFFIDAGLTTILIEAGWSALYARIPAIFGAVIFTWFANRRYTFKVKKTLPIHKVASYFCFAGAGSVLNFVIYSGLLHVVVLPLVAIIVASFIVSVFSYYSYKYVVFY